MLYNTTISSNDRYQSYSGIFYWFRPTHRTPPEVSHTTITLSAPGLPPFQGTVRRRENSCKSDPLHPENTNLLRFKGLWGYAWVFAVTVKLGGRLTSTHHVEKNEKDKISEVKNKLRVAAAISVSGPVAAGSFKGLFEHQNEKNTKSSDVSNKDTLAWEATGGDTTLASNPVAWAPTLKDLHNWRVTEIREPLL
ncbi:hypothetical protein BDV39DRAFT_206788 [Aspergillus sergii]|uniref:Uncharacterized protein n=1 Tax=Aspergillus sergii TaxID=1034303 RepID=A0A5N6X025_9EURO|nr:hypothetical protein BDV39DRAFT_206788 [Aspergillus sergii]